MTPARSGMGGGGGVDNEGRPGLSTDFSSIRAEASCGVRAERPLTAELMRTGDAETRELLGEFTW